MKYFGEFTLIKKLIGSGPETFSIYVLIYDLNANLRQYGLNFDSMHNEWLQHLFETGIIGFLSYYGMNISCITDGMRAVNKEPGGRAAAENKRLVATAFSFALIIYLVQSVINISVPIILPTAILCMSAASAAGRIEA